MALSARQRVHGLEPSHLDFFIRQRSQALQTRFLSVSVDSEELVRDGADMVSGCAGDTREQLVVDNKGCDKSKIV